MFAAFLTLSRSDKLLFVAAAGNDNSANPVYPAAYPGVMAVAALDGNGNKANYSNYGNWVTLSAVPPEYHEPIGHEWGGYQGERVYITNFQIHAGTSFSAPKVAATAASVWAYKPQLTATEVEDLILQHVQPLPQNNYYLLGQLGKGMLNIEAILSFVSPELATAIAWRKRTLLSAMLLGLIVVFLVTFSVPFRSGFND